ncbi:MAG: DUF6797 domain-containing protein [Planctomycetota bacterium]|nr:DUF6797 domain-containing protein [Planctomycetota bacterium]
MNTRSPLAVTACIVSFLLAGSAPDAMAQKWVEMDYGPNMTHSFQVVDAPGRNIAYKGMKIRLGDRGSMLFDEDLLRWAGGWTDCDLNWRNVIYDGSHGTHPGIVGSTVFSNDVAPGWNSKNDFADPRKLPYGPLSKSQARFLGNYRHGDRIVVQFNVGKATVLESCSLENGYLTRTSNLSGNASDLFTQLVTARSEKIEVSESNGVVRVTLGPLPEVKKKVAEEPAEVTGQLVANWEFSEDGKSVVNRLKKGKATSNEGARMTPGPRGRGISMNGKSRVVVNHSIDLASKDFTISGWIKTTRDGTIAAKGPRTGKWEAKGKTLFVRGGKLVFDVGWVGAVQSSRRIADGQWHAVAVTCDAGTGKTTLYVDGQKDGQGNLKSEDHPDHVFRLGYTATNFAPPLRGAVDDLRFYQRRLSDEEVARLAGAAAAEPTVSELAIIGIEKKDVLVDGNQVRLRVPAGRDRFKVHFFRGDLQQWEKFGATVEKTPSIENLTPLTEGGPTNYAELIRTKGQIAEDKGAYVTDQLTLPHDNPWKSWMRIGGFDFFKDPTRAALCTWSGDVWTVSGIDGNYENLTWRRIATGMFQPLGLKIVKDEIYVGCRDQITKLVDLNGDGETDFYQTFNNDHEVTEHFHEFAMDLQVDREGNFYYAKSARHALDSVVPHHGTLIRVSSDGRTSEIVCNGFRAANGVGIGPQGEMATSDQEGHWTPANRINLVRRDGFYGNMYSFHRGERPTGYDPPLVWLPKNVDRSPAAQLWCDSRKWGPFYGKMLSTSYGTGKLWHVLNETVDGQVQGGVVRFPVQFPTGVMRGRFHPVDGQLYTCGLFGWSSNQTQPGGFYRVRFTGQEVNLPVAMKTAEDGIYITFSDALDSESAGDSDNFSVEQWNYRWTKNYGSAHYSVENPKRKGQDEVEVWEASLGQDGKTVFLEIEDLAPVMQMQISYTLKSRSGKSMKNSIWLTINRVGK